jgi:hypothetical protein
LTLDVRSLPSGGERSLLDLLVEKQRFWLHLLLTFPVEGGLYDKQRYGYSVAVFYLH